jgi:hypothetical protein
MGPFAIQGQKQSKTIHHMTIYEPDKNFNFVFFNACSKRMKNKKKKIYIYIYKTMIKRYH